MLTSDEVSPATKAWLRRTYHRLDLAELQSASDERMAALVRRLTCPATCCLAGYETSLAERELLTPLPEPLCEPFDLVFSLKATAGMAPPSGWRATGT